MNQQGLTPAPGPNLAIVKQHQIKEEPQDKDLETTFRFMDLPAEIRVSIYTILFTTSQPIQIVSSFMGRKRAIQKSLRDVDDHHDEDVRCQDCDGKRFGQPPSTTVLAQVSKQLAVETLPLIYGLNTFEFGDVDDLDLFLKGVGSAIQHLKYISVTGCLHDYYARRPRVAFARLTNATALRSLTLSHRCVADARAGSTRLARPEDIVRGLYGFLHARSEAQKQQGSGLIAAFDVVKVVTGAPCQLCREGKKFACTEPLSLWVRNSETQRSGGPLCESKRVHEHAQKMSQRIRSAMARELGVERPTA